MKLLVTGGAGFIGSHFIRSVLIGPPDWEVVNLDKLTYAGDVGRLKDVEGHPRYRWVRGDMADRTLVGELFAKERFDLVVNFAAETHVDRSILDPSPFLHTNVIGVQILLEAVRDAGIGRLVHVSCYDQETRALTTNGLKHYWDISPGDKVLSLNRQTGAIEEKEVEKVIVQEYSGEMVHFKSNRIDLLVTPNHPMFFSTSGHPDLIRIEPAEVLRHRASVSIPRGKWKGIDAPAMSIPGLGEFATPDVFYVAGVFIGDGFISTQQQRRPNKTGLPRVEYLKKARDRNGRFCFPGKIGGAEYATLTRHRIFFDVPRNDKARQRLEQSLNNLGIRWTAHEGKAGQHIYFSSALWSKFFEQFGVGFVNKHVPRWMLEYDVKYLRCLFDGLIDSDGSYRNGGLPCFSTSSPQLVADVCELGFKFGLFPRLSIRRKTSAPLKSGRTIQSSAEAYLVYFRNTSIGIDKDVARVRPYTGRVWCLKVQDNKNFIVERRGTMAFCGNTDEVYGPILEGVHPDTAPLSPRSPYAASKAAGDLLVQAYQATYGLPAIIVRPTNAFGPGQFPEKLIPLCITNALDDQPIPVYGDGLHRRTWLFVADLCQAIARIVERGEEGCVYNVTSPWERPNLEVVRAILQRLGKPERLLQFVQDRPGHDRRYAMQDAKLRALGWQPSVAFEEGLRATIAWYRDHPEWWRPLKARLHEDPYHWLNRAAGSSPRQAAGTVL